MLDKNRYIVKQHAKLMSSKLSYDILDPENQQVLAVVTEKTTAWGNVIGLIRGKHNQPLSLEVRARDNDKLVFSVRRSGWLFPKVEVLDAEGQVLGAYKAKMFSLSGGFNVYDTTGKHVCEIQGSLFKSEYKFIYPEGKKLMGSVSKSWPGGVKALLAGANTYGIQFEPDFVKDEKAKIRILGAALAIDALFKKSGGAVSGGGGGDDE